MVQNPNKAFGAYMLKHDKQKKTAVRLSVISNSVLVVAKLMVGIWTGSVYQAYL